MLLESWPRRSRGRIRRIWHSTEALGAAVVLVLEEMEVLESETEATLGWLRLWERHRRGRRRRRMLVVTKEIALEQLVAAVLALGSSEERSPEEE